MERPTIERVFVNVAQYCHATLRLLYELLGRSRGRKGTVRDEVHSFSWFSTFQFIQKLGAVNVNSFSQSYLKESIRQ